MVQHIISIFALLQVIVVTIAQKDISSLSQLPLDENDHLESHWLLFGEKCGNKVSTAWDKSPIALRNIALATNKALGEISLINGRESECVAVCLERGTPSTYIQYPFPESIYIESDGDNLEDWIFTKCQQMEIGFVSYHHNPATIFWVRPEDGERIPISDLLYGEKNTFWTTTVLGHEFEVVDQATEELLGSYLAEFNSFFPIGEPPSMLRELEDEKQQASDMFDFEFDHFQGVKRTFTELGFKKGRLPEDVWGSMQAYLYNNHDHFTNEEYEDVSINFYEVAPGFLGMPWGLKGYWQSRGREMVERWIGGKVPLENTDIYGIRSYHDGARLLTHVDRQSTHAVSMIVNLAQYGMRSPWMVEIYDHANRLHEVEMQPGDVVYYESAKALHGRMTPLEGDAYINLFTHYRPVGDPEWYLKPNPEGTPEPLIDITGLDIPTLSPKNHVLTSGKDLYDYWVAARPVMEEQDL